MAKTHPRPSSPRALGDRARARTPAAALVAAALVALVGPIPVRADPRALRADYDALLEWQFSDEPVAVPAGGLAWTVDTASWELSSGLLWLQRPTADGTVTGFVFEGEGRFRMTVPDPVELRQLRRLARAAELESVDQAFDALVARGVGGPPFDRLPGGAAAFRRHPLAADRHDHWLRLRGHDADARVVAALARAADRYLRVDMRTRRWKWLTYDLDDRRPEEIRLERFNPEYAFLESWVSLDRPEDRDPRGRPGPRRRPALDILRVGVTADLSHPARESEKGLAKIRPVDAELAATLEVESLVDGEGALQLFLQPWAEVSGVADGEGRELPFLRDHLGGRSSAIDRQLYDDSLVVLLERPLDRGERLALSVDYELEITGFAPGRLWYPATEHPREGLTDRHTARLELAAREDQALRAMGLREESEAAGDESAGVWTVEAPVKMVTFALARRSFEEILTPPESPEVAAFGSINGFLSRARVREAGRHVARSLEFFEQLFDSPLAGDRLQTVLIPATHGQAFDGFLHLPDYTAAIDRVAVQELFRAHEVAHQWWGHRVGWQGYRHQWLSEAFAEYSAMMFVESRVEGGERYFQEMLKAFRDEITGSLNSTFSQFTRPGFQLLNRRARDRVGPVAHGYRCAVGEAPGAYLTLAYKKGAMVLHTLRMSSRALTGTDQAFIDILRAFLRRHEGGQATTDDFAALVGERLPGDWDWFFDQWIYGAEIPTYLWSWEAGRGASGEPLLRLRIEQREVMPPFRISVPVRVTFADGSEELLLARADGPEAELELAPRAPPEKVVFNPDQAVLARVKQTRWN